MEKTITNQYGVSTYKEYIEDAEKMLSTRKQVYKNFSDLYYKDNSKSAAFTQTSWEQKPIFVDMMSTHGMSGETKRDLLLSKVKASMVSMRKRWCMAMGIQPIIRATTAQGDNQTTEKIQKISNILIQKSATDFHIADKLATQNSYDTNIGCIGVTFEFDYQSKLKKSFIKVRFKAINPLNLILPSNYCSGMDIDEMSVFGLKQNIERKKSAIQEYAQSIFGQNVEIILNEDVLEKVINDKIGKKNIHINTSEQTSEATETKGYCVLYELYVLNKNGERELVLMHNTFGVLARTQLSNIITMSGGDFIPYAIWSADVTDVQGLPVTIPELVFPSVIIATRNIVSSQDGSEKAVDPKMFVDTQKISIEKLIDPEQKIIEVDKNYDGTSMNGIVQFVPPPQIDQSLIMSEKIMSEIKNDLFLGDIIGGSSSQAVATVQTDNKQIIDDYYNELSKAKGMAFSRLFKFVEKKIRSTPHIIIGVVNLIGVDKNIHEIRFDSNDLKDEHIIITCEFSNRISLKEQLAKNNRMQFLDKFCSGLYPTSNQQQINVGMEQYMKELGFDDTFCEKIKQPDMDAYEQERMAASDITTVINGKKVRPASNLTMHYMAYVEQYAINNKGIIDDKQHKSLEKYVKHIKPIVEKNERENMAFKMRQQLMAQEMQKQLEGGDQ